MSTWLLVVTVHFSRLLGTVARVIRFACEAREHIETAATICVRYGMEEVCSW